MGELRELKEFVEIYYGYRIPTAANIDNQNWLRTQEQQHLAMIQKRIDLIDLNSPRNRLLTFLDIFTDDETLNLLREEMGLPRFVADNDNPPADYFDTMNSLVMTNIEAQINLLLDINIITVMPSLAPAINDSTGWSYNLPAITDSTAGIPANGGDGPSSIGNDPQPTATNSGPGNTGGITEKRPVAFQNDGYYDATIRPATYAPANGENSAVPVASTVVSTYSNSSAYLELPLGTYTFCYDWDTGEDYDKDGSVDYSHAFTSSFTLTANASQNVENAALITFSAPGNSSKRGKCGQQFEAYTNLTPQEAAAVGMHTYQNTMTKTDGSKYPYTEQKEYQFSETGVYIIMPGDGVIGFYERVAPNEYELNDSAPTTLTFTDTGAIYVGTYDGGYTTISNRID